MSLQLWDGFEDGSLDGWSVPNGEWEILSNRTFNNSSYSAGYDIRGSGNYVLASRLWTGERQRIELYYQESTYSYGGGYELLDENGNQICGWGTTNPDMCVTKRNTTDTGPAAYNFATPGSGTSDYGVWVRTLVELDPANSTVDFAFERMDDPTIYTTTESYSVEAAYGNLAHSINALNISEPSHLANRTVPSDTNYVHWTDDIQHEDPAAPSGMSAVTASADAIDLSWTDNSQNEAGFHIDRSTDGGSSWSRLASVGYNKTAYTDSGLTDGETYTYRVRAYNSAANSSWSSSDSATTDLPAPTSTQVASIDSPADATIEFTDEADNEDGFIVERSEDGGAWEQVAAPGALSGTGTTQQVAVTLSSQSVDTVQYRVRAESADTVSDWSSTATVSTNVKSLTIDATRETEIDLSWQDGDMADAYHVYRSQEMGAIPSRVGEPTTRSFTDTGLESGEKYVYQVCAVYGSEEDVNSSEQPATTDLPAPSLDSLDASVEDEITVNYSLADNSTDGTVEILRSTDDSAGTSVASISDLSATSYTDTGREDGEKYHYTVRRNTDHTTKDSAQVAATALLPAVSSLTVDAVNGDTADLSWTANHDYGNTRVEIRRTDDGESVWTNDSGALTKSTTAYTTSPVLDGEKYYARVVAYTEHTDAYEVDVTVSGTETVADGSTGSNVSPHINQGRVENAGRYEVE